MAVTSDEQKQPEPETGFFAHHSSLHCCFLRLSGMTAPESPFRNLSDVSLLHDLHRNAKGRKLLMDGILISNSHNRNAARREILGSCRLNFL